MSITPEISIIILNYKTRGLLRQCLRGIASSGDAIQKQIIVVDNFSGDGSVEMIEEEFPEVVLIASPENRGFGAGMNLGLKRATGRYAILLNTDVAIMEQPFDKLVKFMDQHPRVGLAGPKLLNPDGSVQYSCYRFHKWYTPILRRSPLGTLPKLRNHLKRFLMKDFSHQENYPVDWLLGAFLIVRLSAIKTVGLFDERFFLYFEDVDWCRRFWSVGWEVNYVADVQVVHYHKRESAEIAGFSGIFAYPTRQHIKSWFRYLSKYSGTELPIRPN
ncbi:MAG: glycosyltransferase family 2 protein [Candidatus Kerfeldbacteria bacterium CG08_land_8_20_14_0_20_43_14]|uniref:Glycosyltransferase family 2 protein n=1 Tax=Candidatus Kerfeldbacteria bacterium CG08_land_8_20_14_0_20_43_14 TaxID=2014246 RepID=A0A2H0YPY6_9BACT|nr:MAG: glycosyltransferase family 2 protein [Candidatus Kerfeldbacteria bacterium CG08_land_8_20_14_0_20_43_14]